MTTSLATSLDALSCWKSALEPRLASFSAFLDQHGLSDATSRELVASMRRRLTGDKSKVAFVAQFSHSALELVNAILFADTGRRVLPATVGRDAECPVELRYDANQLPGLSMLPIESRQGGKTVAELQTDTRAWTHVRLQGSSPSQLAGALAEVMRTKEVSQREAQVLGCWDETDSENKPTPDGQARVEIPAWRYAVVNYPHPLLQRGLVVLCAPGLCSPGVEAELAHSALSGADATVFVLAADAAGVTASDMVIWRAYLAARASSCLVVLDGIETPHETLLTAEQKKVRRERLRQAAAQALKLSEDRVFGLSAREALMARVEGDVLALQRSRVPDLEGALGSLLLQQCTVLQAEICDSTRQLRALAKRRFGEQRRQVDGQLLDLQGLQGKSRAKMHAMLQRLDVEEADFEQCTAKLQALRLVHSRMVKELLFGLMTDRLHKEAAKMRQVCFSLLRLGAKKFFSAMCARLRESLSTAQARAEEIHAMLDGSFARLNAEFGFGLAVEHEPDLTRYMNELRLIEHNYEQYFGLKQALRLAQPRFRDEFCSMLVSRLVVVFEAAHANLESWNRATSQHLESRLRARMLGFKRRREALERAHSVRSDLERRMGEIEAQDATLRQSLSHAGELAEDLLEHAQIDPATEDALADTRRGERDTEQPAPADSDQARERAVA